MRSLGYLLAFLLGMAAMVAIQGWSQSYAVVSGLAIHLDGEKHCNSFTSGLGVERPISGTVRYALGFFDNSNCRWSTYAALAWLPLTLGNWKAGTISGAVTGYRESLLPAAGAVLVYERPTWGLNLILIPPSGDSSAGVLWCQWKLRWG